MPYARTFVLSLLKRLCAPFNLYFGIRFSADLILHVKIAEKIKNRKHFCVENFAKKHQKRYFCG